MYRIEASCRRHPQHHARLIRLLRNLNWYFKVEENICKIQADFATIAEAKAAKHDLEVKLRTLERFNKPALPYSVVFSNTFWIGKVRSE